MEVQNSLNLEQSPLTVIDLELKASRLVSNNKLSENDCSIKQSPLVLFSLFCAVFCTMEFLTQNSAVFLSPLMKSQLFKKSPHENESNHSVGSGLFSQPALFPFHTVQYQKDTFLDVVYFDQQTHAYAYVHMVENNKKVYIIVKKVLFSTQMCQRRRNNV